MLPTICTQILFHTGYDVYILVQLSQTYTGTTSVAVLTLWVAPPKMLASI